MGECQQPGQGEGERRGAVIKLDQCEAFSPDVSQVTLWDLVKEGSLEQLTVVLDSLKEQVRLEH